MLLFVAYFSQLFVIVISVPCFLLVFLEEKIKKFVRFVSIVEKMPQPAWLPVVEFILEY